MAGLTQEGFVIKRFDDILTEINDKLRTNLGFPIDTSGNSVAGNLNAVVASELAELWELGLNVYDGLDLYAAEGEQLDRLGNFQGLIRIAATPTRGIVWLTGVNGTSISSGRTIKALSGELFDIENNTVISTTNSVALDIVINTAVNTEPYQVVVNGKIITYTSDATATKEEIRDGLFTLLDSETNINVTKDSTDTIKLTATDSTQALNISGTSFITFENVTTPTIARSQKVGFISGDARSLIEIQTPVNGWNSVTNPSDLNLGRLDENDVEYRQRILRQFGSTGAATYESVRSKVQEITNVQDVTIKENNTWATDTTIVPNQPPKSYTVTVNDGDTNEIGRVIWETKPLGVQTVGNTRVDLTDRFGQAQTVYFSRPTTLFTWVKVTYTVYSEETLPTNADALVRLSCLLYGDSLNIGNDIIPQRFAGQIYSRVTGIDNITIEVAVTSNPDITNANDPSLVYSTSRIPISETQVTTFGNNRIIVTKSV